MSLITRCPACSTLFRVVPDQLRISDGWVRCGRCDEVFDGRAQLQEPTPEQPDGLMVPDRQSGQPAAFDPSQVTAAQTTPVEESLPATTKKTETLPDARADYDWSGVLDGGHADAPVAKADIDTDPLLEISPGERHDTPEPPPPADLDIVPSAEIAASQPDVPDFPVAETPAVRYVQSDVALIPAVEDAKVTFLSLNDTGQRNASRSPIVMSIFAVALILLLGAQALVHERHLIATSYPASKSLLEAACDGLGCTLEPLRRIDSVVIDSSSFIKVRGDVFRLNFSLKNSGMVEIAAPALELTLTDSQDETLARKILYPEQYLASSSPAKILMTGFTVEATVPVQVKTPLNPQRVAGYRLLAFYP